MEKESGIQLLIIALVGDILTALVKLVAGLLSRSSALLSEGIHSVVDVVNQLLLLLGLRQDPDQQDKYHPFGAGKTRFYWSFVVSMVVFGAASVLPISYGFNQILDPRPLADFNLTYLVLISSFSFQLVSLTISTGVFFRGVKGLRGFIKRLELHKDIAASTVWLEDTLAIIGILIATIGIVLTQVTGDPVFDGIASVLIGLLLLAMGFMLAQDARHILIDQSISPQVYERIVESITGFEQVSQISGLDAALLHGTKIFVRLKLEMAGSISSKDQKMIHSQIADTIKQQVPLVHRVFF